jgi:tRNA threonylcarbamoyladenosine biosynthesis protein TsaB
MSKSDSIILAIETATPACSVALSTPVGVIERMEVGSNIHSKVLLNMVQSVLCEAELESQHIDAIAVGSGPGSFTGLRIGVGVGQGLAFGVDCPMIGISSLDALASQSTKTGAVIAGIDARMGQVYWCNYSKDKQAVVRQGDLRVSDPSEIRCESDKLLLVGNAWQEYWDQLEPGFKQKSEHLDNIVYPSALAILRLAKIKFDNEDYVSAADFAPEYVRNDVADKPKKLEISK